MDKVTLAGVAQDRLGSIGKFYPYGQERPSATQNDTEKFTGYYRDASTGLDYADQRYHQDGVGRFMSPDPFGGSAHPTDPSSQNRYTYVVGDPINGRDPTGLCGQFNSDFCIDATGVSIEGGGTDFGGPVYLHGNDSNADLAAEEADRRRTLANSFAVENCTVAMRIDGQCGDSSSMVAGFGAALARRLGVAGMLATAGWAATVKFIGDAGEAIVAEATGLVKNYQALPGSGRIPDFWDQTTNTIIEVKNVSSLSLTSQLRDMMVYAADTPGGTFQLWVRQGAVLSDELQQAAKDGLIKLEFFDWP